MRVSAITTRSNLDGPEPCFFAEALPGRLFCGAWTNQAWTYLCSGYATKRPRRPAPPLRTTTSQEVCLSCAGPVQIRHGGSGTGVQRILPNCALQRHDLRVQRRTDPAKPMPLGRSRRRQTPQRSPSAPLLTPRETADSLSPAFKLAPGETCLTSLRSVFGTRLFFLCRRSRAGLFSGLVLGRVA